MVRLEKIFDGHMRHRKDCFSLSTICLYVSSFVGLLCYQPLILCPVRRTLLGSRVGTRLLSTKLSTCVAQLRKQLRCIAGRLKGEDWSSCSRLRTFRHMLSATRRRCAQSSRTWSQTLVSHLLMSGCFQLTRPYAVKYTTEGSIKVQCSTYGEPAGLRCEDQMVIKIVVADTGCGIQHPKLESIFMEFEQVDSEEAAKGAAPAGVGLGLAVVARIVEQLGGQLRVDSVVGEGSTFSFLVPLSLCSNPPGPEDPLKVDSSSGRSSAMSSQRSIASSLDGLVEALSTAKLSPERHNWRKLHSVENGGQVSEQPHTIAQIPVQPCVQDQPVAVAERGKTMQPSSPPDSTPVVGKQRTEGLRVLIVEVCQLRSRASNNRLIRTLGQRNQPSFARQTPSNEWTHGGKHDEWARMCRAYRDGSSVRCRVHGHPVCVSDNALLHSRLLT